MTNMVTESTRQRRYAPRMTKGRLAAIEQAKLQGIELDITHFLNKTAKPIPKATVTPTYEESFEDIKVKVKERFNILEEIVLSTALGINPSLIISGGAGTGKSHTVFETTESLGIEHTKTIRGKVTPVGLFQLLYEYRFAGSLLVFDDSDDCWADDTTINLLKAATDTTEDRTISWHSSKEIYDEDGEPIPSDFLFNGAIIFISNIDFYREANSNSKLAPHFKAMISRSFVLDVDMKNTDYFLARVHQVLFECIPNDEIEFTVKNDIFEFMMENKATLREVSLRMVKKISTLMLTYNKDWEAKAKVLLCK